MKKFLLSVALPFALLVGLSACNSNSGGTATFSANITDAPAKYDAVTISINDIRVNTEEDAETSEDETDEEAEEDGWESIMDEPMEINLLQVSNGNTIKLGAEEVESGTYEQVRLILGDNNTVTVDGQTYDLQTPSGSQSGLKLNVDADVEEETTYNLLIDFDAARSIVKQGNGNYLLKPVIRAVNLAQSGSVVGSVTPTDFNTNVLAVLEEDTVTSTIAADDGSFELIGLAPNSNYEIYLDPSSDQYSETSETGVEVMEGEETDIGTVELPSK